MSTDYTDFFLNTAPSVYRIEALEISHSDFSQTYYIQSDVSEAVTLTLEGAGGNQSFQYFPLAIKPNGSHNDLDSGVSIQVGDLGQTLPDEIDAVIAGDGFGEKPVVKYRVYRSDDTSAPAYGPLTFEITGINFSNEGASFEARSRSLNLNRTGERYTIDRFPMLSGYL
jgi:hypothetical protein